MFSLILKDFMLLRVRMWFQVGFWVFFLGRDNGSGIPFLIISLMLAGIPMGIDEKNKTESLFVSLPVKRSAIVIARYIYILLVIAVVITATYFSSRVLNTLLPTDFEKAIPFNNLLAAQLPVVFLMSLACPFSFRYGSHLEAGIRAIAISISVIFVTITLLIAFWDNIGIDIFSIKLIYTSLGMGVVMLISMGISLLIYKRREF
jgi:ABC-type transport system involved in multi-copper enzyme maturation permease subunit